MIIKNSSHKWQNKKSKLTNLSRIIPSFSSKVGTKKDGFEKCFASDLKSHSSIVGQKKLRERKLFQGKTSQN